MSELYSLPFKNKQTNKQTNKLQFLPYFCVTFHIVMKVMFVPTNINILLAINEFRCYEAKIEESEKVSNHRELNPEHLWLEPPVLCH